MDNIVEFSSYKQEWVDGKCDKYDYLMAVACGTFAGVIDIFLVGIPGQSILGTLTDAQADEMVKKFAHLTGWNPRKGNEENIKSAIGYLEEMFKINYDMKSTSEVDKKFEMGTKNHHFKSLGHQTDVIGLFFSILDQYTHKASFLSDGKLIRINDMNKDFKLYGKNPAAKIYCGFCNWFGHIMSDMAGSSGAKGRGTGVPAPFMGLFQLCDFGELREGENLQTLATVMTEVFQKGYDLRFAAATAVPVIINDLIITVCWVVRRRYQRKYEWKDCFPRKAHADLRIMKIVGFTTFCTIDAGDAALKSDGHAVLFVLRMNYFAWLRLLILVFKELRIRYGEEVIPAYKSFIEMATPYEKKMINEFSNRMEIVDEELEKMFAEYIAIINKEYIEFHNTLELVYDESRYSIDERSILSVKLAQKCGVENPFDTLEDVRDYFS